MVKGPFKANSVVAKSLLLSGPIDVNGTLAASESITINVGFSQSPDAIKVDAIKAPRVEIRSNQYPWLLRRFFKSKIAQFNVPIETDELILNGVRHSGFIKAGNIILENGGEYRELLDS